MIGKLQQFKKQLSILFLICYCASVSPTLILESAHFISHFTEVFQGDYHTHSLQDKVVDHTHVNLNNIATNQGDKKAPLDNKNTQKSKNEIKSQHINQRPILAALDIKHEFSFKTYLSQHYLLVDSPPPDLMV